MKQPAVLVVEDEPAIAERYPGLVGGVIHATGVTCRTPG